VNGQPNYDARTSLLDCWASLCGHHAHDPNRRIRTWSTRQPQDLDGEVRVYENRDALARVFIAPQAIAVPIRRQALDLLETVNPAEVVVHRGRHLPK